MIAPLKCLRPCIRPCNQPGPRSVSAYIRFYSAVQAQFEPRIRKTHDLEYPQGHYPRIKSQEAVLDFTTFRERYRGLKSDESKVGEEVVVRGMSPLAVCMRYLAYVLKEEYGHSV